MNRKHYVLLFSLPILFCVTNCSEEAANEKKPNNVCDTFEAYRNIDHNNHCWYNPDIDSEPKEIAARHGFRFERHTVQTEDNYLLTLFRIWDESSGEQNGPVLLQHGLGSNAMAFLGRGNLSLGFYLARKGYDVWLNNVRGSIFNKDHAALKTTDSKYWDFSFHEMGVYDMPAVIEYIYTQAQNQKLVYIGHSMGTTIGFVYATQRKEHAEKHVKAFLMLAVTTSFKHLSPNLKNMNAASLGVAENFKSATMDVLFYDPATVRDKAVSMCFRSSLAKFCASSMLRSLGGSLEEISVESLPVLLAFSPDRISMKTINHYLQNIKLGEFRMMDYGGPEGNKRRYDSLEPPLYDLGDITVPVHIFYGEGDLLANKEDSYETYNSLVESKNKSIIKVPPNSDYKLGHIDFLLVKNVEKFVNEPILDVLKSSTT